MPRAGLQRFFERPAVELSVGVLIVVSVVLTLAELAVASSSPALPILEAINDTVTCVFVIELALRFVAAPRKRRFLRTYWIDIIAVLPLFRVFRVARALRLLRLVRTLRLLGILTRYASYFPYIVRRGALEYIIIVALVLVTIVFGAGAMVVFERGENPAMRNVWNAFWFSVYSLFAGEPIPGPPVTVGGRIVAVFITFMGLTTFAMLTGTVSAFMVERIRMEGRIMSWEDLEDHVIVCGWGREAEIIVREYRAGHHLTDPIVVITSEEDPQFEDESLRKNVQFLHDDFTKVSALERAGVHRARTCIILSDLGDERSPQDADARTILAALTVEKLNPAVYTCAELHHKAYGSHLEMGGVNDYVVSSETSAFLLAQASLNRGLVGVFSELLTYERGNQFYRLPLPARWIGRPFDELFVELKRDSQAILLAVRTAAGAFLVNPLDHCLAQGDELVVIARQEPAGFRAERGTET